MDDHQRFRDVALQAATAAGQVIARTLAGGPDRLHGLGVETKGRGDYVTAVDRAAEAAALTVLAAGAPGIAVLAEESAAGARLPQGRVWAVDPLDGTTNFIRAFPVVGVSVGLLEDGVPVAGAVVAPLLGAGWSAARGCGAHDLGGNRLSVRVPDGRGVAATGFPFRLPATLPGYLAVFERVIAAMEDIRRAGAASLDLAYAAQGSFDGFFELGLAPWDVAAGALLVREAGGIVTDWRGDGAAWIESGDILAGSPAWHQRMLELVSERVAP